jgi:hypothetical protein
MPIHITVSIIYRFVLLSTFANQQYMIVVIDIKVIRTVNSLLASVEDNCQYMQVKTNKRYKEDYTTPVKTISRDDIYNILLQFKNVRSSFQMF